MKKKSVHRGKNTLFSWLIVISVIIPSVSIDTIRFELARPKMRSNRERRAGDPLSEYVEKMAIVARITNAISLQAGLMDGSIPIKDAVGELLNFGSIRVDDVISFEAEKVTEALDKLEAIRMTLDSTDKVKKFERQIIDMNRIRNGKGSVELKLLNGSTEYFGEIRKLKSSTIDFSVFMNSGDVLDELWKDLESFLKITVSVNRLDEAVRIVALNKKIKAAENLINSIKATRRLLSSFSSIKKGENILVPVEELLKLIQRKAEINTIALDLAVQNLDKVLNISTILKPAETPIQLIDALLSSRIQNRQLPRNFTAGFPLGLLDAFSLNSDCTNGWTINALGTHKNLSKFNNGLEPIGKVMSGMSATNDLLYAVSTTAMVESAKLFHSLNADTSRILVTIKEAETVFDKFVDCIRKNPSFVDTELAGKINTVLDSARELTVSFQMTEDMLQSFPDEFADNVTSSLNDFKSKIRFSDPNSFELNEIPKIIKDANSIPSASKDDLIAVLKNSSSRLTNHGKAELNLKKLAELVDEGIIREFQKDDEVRIRTSFEECLSKTKSSDEVVVGLQLVEKLRDLPSDFGNLVQADNAMKLLSETLPTTVSKISDSLKNGKTADVIDLNKLKERSPNAYSVIGRAVRGLRNIAEFDAMRSSVSVLKNETDFVADKLLRVTRRKRRSASSPLDIQQKWGNHSADIASLEAALVQIDLFRTKIEVGKPTNLVDGSTVWSDAQKIKSVKWNLTDKLDAISMLIRSTSSSKDIDRLGAVRKSLEELGSLDLQFARYHQSFSGASSALKSVSDFFVLFFEPPKVIDSLSNDQNSTDGSSSHAPMQVEESAWLSNHQWCLYGPFLFVAVCSVIGGHLLYKKVHPKPTPVMITTSPPLPQPWLYIRSWLKAFEFGSVEEARKTLESYLLILKYQVDAADACDYPPKNRTNIAIKQSSSVAVMMSLDREHEDYWINANEITTITGGRIRVCQAPQLEEKATSRPSTRADFWFMIWTDQTSRIVQLGDKLERGEWCGSFPELDSKETEGDFTVTTTTKGLAIPGNETIIKRTLVLSRNGVKKDLQITHYQYLGWNELDVPETPEHVYLLWKLLETPNDTSPIVVHCKTGHGRSVIFAGVKYFSEWAERVPKKPFESMAYAFRAIRFMGITNLAQVYFMVLAIVYKLNKDRNPEDMSDYETQLKMFKSLRHTLLQEIPERLKDWDEVRGWIEKQEFFSLNDTVDYFFGVETVMRRPLAKNDEEKNERKVFGKHAINKNTAVKITGSNNERVWINASEVVTRSGTVFRVTQAPMDGSLPNTDNTVEDFWLMVFQGKTQFVIQLCQAVEPHESNFKLSTYFPAPSDTLTLSRFRIKTKSMNRVGDLIERKIDIEDIQSSEVISIMHIEHTMWTQASPESIESSVRLLQRVNRCKTPIVVMCATGNGKSMAFVGVEYAVREVERDPNTSFVEIMTELNTARHLALSSNAQKLYVAIATKLMLTLEYEQQTDDYEKRKTHYVFMRTKFLNDEERKFNRRQKAEADLAKKITNKVNTRAKKN